MSFPPDYSGDPLATVLSPLQDSGIEPGLYKNTDRELWRERPDDYYANSIHVTASGGVGINVGGLVVVKTLAAWHALANVKPPLPQEQPIADVPEPTRFYKLEEWLKQSEQEDGGLSESEWDEVGVEALRRAIHAERQLAFEKQKDKENQARIAELEETLFCAGQDEHRECLQLIAKEQRLILAALKEVAARDARIVELEQYLKESERQFQEKVAEIGKDIDKLAELRALIREKDAALEPFANAAEAEEGDWMCDNNRRAKAALERKETT